MSEYQSASGGGRMTKSLDSAGEDTEAIRALNRSVMLSIWRGVERSPDGIGKASAVKGSSGISEISAPERRVEHRPALTVLSGPAFFGREPCAPALTNQQQQHEIMSERSEFDFVPIVNKERSARQPKHCYGLDFLPPLLWSSKEAAKQVDN